MGTKYTRNDTSNNIADGNIINATDLDGEFDAVQAAFATSGHTHDGTVGEGGPVTVVGPAQDLVISATNVNPKTTNTLDLGTSSLLYKDAYLTGTVTAATLDISGNVDIDGTLETDALTVNGSALVLTANDFTDADHSKLDGIEASATADQSSAEIKAAVEAASDSNTFTDADHSKLNAIEANATIDQTDAEIRTAVEAASDSNVFTDADHSKLNAIEASADVTDATNVTAAGALMDSELSDLAGVKGVTISTLQVKPSEGAFANGDKTKLDAIEASADVTDTANVTSAGALMDSELTDLAGVKGVTISTLQAKPSEGAFVNGDKTKLDAIETSATADQSNAEIRTAVEAASDSNVFTDADHSKLNAIEASADVTDSTNVVAALTAGTGITIASNGTIAAGPLAVTTVQVASSQSAQLALTAQEGDVVVRSDEDKTYMHNSGTAGTMDDYTLLATPTGGVSSVNSVSGVVTAAHIATAVEAASGSNTFTDADHSKLNAIEASADVTDATNVTAAGALMDSELTDLAGVKGVTISTLQVKPSEGAFANGDKTKLDAIESSATADQTNAEIRAAVEAATDSNVFTNADHTKLNAIEASATADQSAAEIKTLLENGIDSVHYVDGSIDTVHIGDDQVTADKLANSINSAIAANTAKVTNATHSGEVTGATALTIADNVVDEANLKVSNTPTNGYALTAQSGNTGGLTWAVAAPIAGSSSIVTTGALNSGSITSGFGTINNGASAITTTGALAAGAATFTGNTTGFNGTTVVTNTLKRNYADSYVGGITWGELQGTDNQDVIMSKITFAREGTAANVKGSLKFYTGGTDLALTLDHSQNATFAGAATVSGGLNVVGTNNTTSTLLLSNTAGTDNNWSFVPAYNAQTLSFLADSTTVLTLNEDKSATFEGTVTANNTITTIAPDTDHNSLEQVASSTTGAVRQLFKNSDNSKNFELSGFFSSGSEQLAVQSKTNTIARFFHGGGTTFEGNINAVAGGINLGATGSANLLDDYEVGTWTPTVSYQSGSPSTGYAAQLGNYVKVGNQVTANIYIVTNAHTAGSGHLQITGFPFTSKPDATYHAGTIGYLQGIGGGATTNTVIPYLPGNGTIMYILSTNNSAVSSVAFASATHLILNITYQTA